MKKYSEQIKSSPENLDKKRVSSKRHNLAQMMESNSFSKQKATQKYKFECDIEPNNKKKHVINLPREPIRCNSHGRELRKITNVSPTSVYSESEMPEPKKLVLLSNFKLGQSEFKQDNSGAGVDDSNYFSFNKPMPG